MDKVGMDIIKFQNKEFPVIVNTNKVSSKGLSRFHEAIEIKSVISGNLTVMIDTKTVCVGKDEVVFINSYEIHSNVIVNDEKATYNIAVIDLDFLSGDTDVDLRHIFMEKGLRFNNLIKNPRAVSVINEIYNEMTQQKPLYKTMVKSLVQQLFTILQREEISQNNISCEDNKVKFYKLVEPAVQALRDKYMEHFAVEDLAKMCKMSKYYFCRTFKKVMGITPISYQVGCRMKVADILLKDGKLSVAEVSNAVGFEDEAYFSRCYKKHRGYSPKNARAILSK